MNKLFLPFFLLLFAQCTVVEHSQETEQQPVPDIELAKQAVERLGEPYAIQENAPKDYIIVFKKHKNLRDLFASVHFFVYKKETKTVVFEDSLKAGTVIWNSDYDILATSRNNNPKGLEGVPATIHYTFNVLTMQKTQIND